MAQALPRIEPYPLPRADELPQGRTDWRPRQPRAALLVHDMQRYFLAPFPADQPPVSALLDNIGALIDICRGAGIPVLYTAQPGRQSRADRGLLLDFWGEGIGAALDADPALERITERLAPGPDDTVLTKWRYSAFQRSPLGGLLAELGRDQLLITGIYAHIGCLVTAVDAFMRDVQPFLVADAVADFSRQHHDRALEYAAQRCATVLTTGQLVAALSGAPQPVRAGR